jgi:tetratricopeptide (TPR) repeat protein
MSAGTKKADEMSIGVASEREAAVVTEAMALAECGGFDAACEMLTNAAREAHAASDAAGAARLWAGAGMLARDAYGSTDMVLGLMRSALEAAERSGDAELFAHTMVLLGETLLDAPPSPVLLQESIRCHQRAERVFRASGDAVSAAVCQVNTAVAYLAMSDGPSSLKPKIAIQCLNAALSQITREGQPELWESAVLNLANALQQTPPAPDGSNIAEAVGLYQDLLEIRRAARDEAGCGRVLANMGCALARLGRFEDAEVRLAEAAACFAGDADALAGVAATRGEIAARRAAMGMTPMAHVEVKA